MRSCRFRRLLILLTLSRAILFSWALSAPCPQVPPPPRHSRRVLLQTLFQSSIPTSVATFAFLADCDPSRAEDDVVVVPATSAPRLSFETTAYGRQEYTNSITASRDTNLSPAEAYDVIRQKIPDNTNTSNGAVRRALDLGSGAGLSTAILCNEKGYTITDAVDWSRTAWDSSVTRQPNGVHFYEMDDSAFFEYALQKQQPQQLPKYDVIVYNFACNYDKAVYAATTFLTCDNPNAVLLAPVNDRRDYWYKQTYVLLNCRGDLIWKSDPEVGAWSVQFQPDVTSDTCQGIWCPPYNGFVKKR